MGRSVNFFELRLRLDFLVSLDLEADGCNFPSGNRQAHLTEHLEWSLLGSKPQAIGFVQAASDDDSCANFYELVITGGQ